MSDGIGCSCAARSENECCCGADWTPKELVDLRQQLASRDEKIAELKVVSDHNLKVYQEAASKMRAEIAELNNRLVTLGGIASTHVGEKEKLREQVEEKETQRQNLMAAYERQGNSAQEVISTLRNEVKVLRVALNDVRTPLEFWISCKTEFGSAYSALLNIVTKALAATRADSPSQFVKGCLAGGIAHTKEWTAPKEIPK